LKPVIEYSILNKNSKIRDDYNVSQRKIDWNIELILLNRLEDINRGIVGWEKNVTEQPSSVLFFSF